jgi:hypothetical protein
VVQKLCRLRKTRTMKKSEGHSHIEPNLRGPVRALIAKYLGQHSSRSTLALAPADQDMVPDRICEPGTGRISLFPIKNPKYMSILNEVLGFEVAVHAA